MVAWACKAALGLLPVLPPGELRGVDGPLAGEDVQDIGENAGRAKLLPM